MLRIFHIGPVERDYDGYDAVVVIAHDEDEAKRLAHSKTKDAVNDDFRNAPIRCVGTANPNEHVGVLLASFNAG